MARRFFDKKRSVSEAVEAAAAGADRSAYLLSISRLADLLGRDRGTISDWIPKGCPVSRSGGTGESKLLDPAAVIAWREQQIRLDEARKYATPEGESVGGVAMKPADLVKLQELDIKRLAFGEKARILVPRYVVEAAFERALAIIREAIMAIPERLVRDMAGFPEDRKMEWRQSALDQCRESLREGAKALATSMPSYEAPAFDDYDETV